MSTEKLTRENQEKRQLLTKENRKCYDDLLVYVRLQLLISEKKSEEILSGLLDDLIAGQAAGKGALHIVGQDPRAYADELIAKLAKDRKASLTFFVMNLVLTLFGFYLLARGGIGIVLSKLRPVDGTLYIFKTVIIIAAVILFTVIAVKFIFNMLNRSLFLDEEEEFYVRHSSIKRSAYFGAIVFIIFIIIIKFTPEIGPTFQLSNIISLISGLALMFLSSLIKKD